MDKIFDRDVRYDCLRILAASMVVFLHVSANAWYSLSPSDFNWKTMNFYDCLVRCAVPLFFMLSGAFLLKKEISIKKLYLAKILPLIVIYFVWSMLYAIDSIGIDNMTSIGIVDFVDEILNSHYHLWFIPVLIGTYVLQPILHSFVNFKNGKYVIYYLICFFVLGILHPTIIEIFRSNQIVITFLNKFSAELFSYCGYIILGYYLANMKNFKIRPIVAIIFYLITVIISAVFAQLVSVKNGKPISFLYGNFMLPVFIEAVLLFICFQNLNFKCYASERFKIFIFRVSTLTMGVYLLHPFVIKALETYFNLNTLSFLPMFSIPVIVVICFVVCLAVTFIMSKIPCIRLLWTF